MPDWYEEDVFCFAVIPKDREVTWAPGTWEPEEAIWPPEGTFHRLQTIAGRLNLPIFPSLNTLEANRLKPSECGELLGRWSEMAEHVENTPGAGWVAAIGLLLRRCTQSPGSILFIDPP